MKVSGMKFSMECHAPAAVYDGEMKKEEQPVQDCSVVVQTAVVRCRMDP
jgi:hypothetical protein